MTYALDGLVDAVALEAAALADAGVIDPESVPCAVCEIPAVGHDDTDAGHPHEVPTAYALAMAALAADEHDAMDDIVDARNAAYQPSGKTGPSPSDAGACRRQLWYRDNPPGDYTPRTDIDERRATLGGIVHDAIQAVGEVRYPWVRYELPIPIPGLDRGGRIDKYDPILGKVSDTKSAGRAKWDMIGEDGPTDSMWEQLRIYGYALDMLGLPVKTLEIVAINRDTGAEEHFTEPYDPAAGLAALDKLVAVASALEGGLEMPRDGYGPNDWRCKWCPALDHCWNTDRAAQLGRSPVSLTLLGEEVEDPSIVWAGLELLRISAERLALEKAEKRAQELLQGIPPRVYGADRSDGGVELYKDWHTSYAYKGALQDREARYADVHALLVDVLGDDLPEDVMAPDKLPPVLVKKTFKTKAKKGGGKRVAARQAPRKRRSKAEAAADVVLAAVGDEPGPVGP